MDSKIFETILDLDDTDDRPFTTNLCKEYFKLAKDSSKGMTGDL